MDKLDRGFAFALGMIDYANKRREELREWIEELRDIGCVAAHPDDGWVDGRGAHPLAGNTLDRTIIFMYPYYNDGIQVGDLVALGTPEEHRIVQLVKRDCSNFTGSITWHYEDIF